MQVIPSFTNFDVTILVIISTVNIFLDYQQVSVDPLKHYHAFRNQCSGDVDEEISIWIQCSEYHWYWTAHWGQRNTFDVSFLTE